MPFALIDTHTHLYSEEFNEDRDAMLQRAINNGVQRFYLPNVDEESIEGMLALEQAYPNHCFAMMGLHPCSVTADYKAQLARIEALLRARPYCAVGEIGLDYYWSRELIEEQKDAFRIQCQWAIELDIPIVIHGRDSLEDLISIIREYKSTRLRGIFHCFSGSQQQANIITGLGFHLGIGGVLTFKNSRLAKFIHEIPLEYIVLETDSPYLTPEPHRGKRNESAYVSIVAQRLADLYGMSYEAVAAQTTANALRIFGE